MRDAKLLPHQTKLLCWIDHLYKGFSNKDRLIGRHRRHKLRAVRYHSKRFAGALRGILSRAASHVATEKIIIFLSTAVIIYRPSRATRNPHYWKMLRRFAPGQRTQFRKLWKKNEQQHYSDKRRVELSQKVISPGTEVDIATSPDELRAKLFTMVRTTGHTNTKI